MNVFDAIKVVKKMKAKDDVPYKVTSDIDREMNKAGFSIDRGITNQLGGYTGTYSIDFESKSMNIRQVEMKVKDILRQLRRKYSEYSFEAQVNARGKKAVCHVYTD